jgi:hypothetical protein
VASVLSLLQIADRVDGFARGLGPNSKKVIATEVAAVLEFTGFILVPDGRRRGRIDLAL